MYCEWPEFRRCCLCMPLRRGVLVFGYLNIIFTIFQILILHIIEVDDLIVLPLHHVSDELPVLLTSILCALKLIAGILLVYGTHTKRTRYVKVYYYFMFFMLLASVIMEILSTVMSTRTDHVILIIYFLFCFGLNLYLLFLVRSLIFKLQVPDDNKFSNQLAEFIDRVPVRNGGVYPEIVIRGDNETVLNIRDA